MNILLFGPPGAGKGTQSAYLVSKKGMHHISTGDLFRYNIKNKTPLGNEAKSYIDKGNLVPDTITINMVDEELKKIGKKNFILDGFPRNVSQAEALEQLLKAHHLEIGKAVFLDVNKEALIARLSGRRVCKGCGAVYHVSVQPSKLAGVCDKCGGEVVQRDDDKESAIRTRLTVYEESTQPLKDYYLKKKLFQRIDGTKDADVVYEELSRVVS